MKYDYLIVGAGLYGAVFAHEMKKKGKKCLVIDKRGHIAGNIFTEKIEGINVHKYGAHIFHTNDKHIWEYINQFAEFNRYTNSPVVIYEDKVYNLPFNMNTFYQLWGVKTPAEARQKINDQIKALNIDEPKNLEEQALSMVGPDIYEILIKGYTEKQWGREPKELPAFIIKRLPVRFTYDNNYFNDKYQGIPIGGYTQIIEKMLEGVEVVLNEDFFEKRDFYEQISNKIVFTGRIDQYYDFCFGTLEYRSLRFESKLLEQHNYQGNAVVNYTSRDIPYTRVIEHKHFEFGNQDNTVITFEYPSEWLEGKECYYPVNDQTNNNRYNRYRDKANSSNNVIFGGRLAEYKYYDMHQIIGSALNAIKKESDESSNLD